MEIVNFKRSPQGSYEMATFDIDFGAKTALIFRRLKLCQSKNGNYYVQLPAYKTDQMENGKNKWLRYFEYYGEKEKGFSNSVLELLKPFLHDTPSSAEEMPF